MSGGTCTATGTGNIHETVNLPAGASVTYTLTGTISASAAGNVSNTASAAPPAGVLDPNPTNDAATDTDPVLAVADLSITKSDGQTTASPGEAHTYTIVVTNAGPSAAIGATVTDVVPAALSGATWTCVGSGGSCTAGGAGNIQDTVDLPSGASVTYTLSGTVSANPSHLRNTATVSPPAGITDPDLANNRATDDDTLACFSEIVVVPDGRMTGATLGAGSTAWFGASLRIGNSYSVEFQNVGDSMPPDLLTLFSGDDGCSGISTLSYTDTTTIDPGASASRRLSFIALGTETFFRARLQNGSGGVVPLAFTWSDTTMYSPAWSTNGSFETFYSLQNSTGATLRGTLTLFDTAGSVLSSSDVVVPPGQTLATNTASLGVPRNRTGTVRLTHDGPPGAMVAEGVIANFSLAPAYVQPVKFEAVRQAR